MALKPDKEIRCYIDVDLKSLKIIKWDHADRITLNKGKSPSQDIHRIFLTIGQYNKFISALE